MESSCEFCGAVPSNKVETGLQTKQLPKLIILCKACQWTIHCLVPEVRGDYLQRMTSRYSSTVKNNASGEEIPRQQKGTADHAATRY